MYSIVEHLGKFCSSILDPRSSSTARPQSVLAGRPLRVLFALQTLEGRPGGSMYVRDIALELLRQGHKPVVYSPRLGSLAEEMRGHTIPVIDRLDQLTTKPDIIHGNTPFETAAAILHFPGSPAIFACHGWDSPDAMPVKMKRVIRYIAVDDTCRDRLVCHEGIPEEQVVVHLNPVDLNKFLPRQPLPLKPRRALIFSSYARQDNFIPAIREACHEAGIQLDVVGEGVGNLCSQPENILGNYDIVFAKARCALEAAAVGTAVVVCDTSGLGSMLTLENWRNLRRMNFGRRTLQNPLESKRILAEIKKYDANDAARVSEAIRVSEGLQTAVESLVALYIQTIECFENTYEPDTAEELRSCAAFFESVAPFANSFSAIDHIKEVERNATNAAIAATMDKLADVMSMQPLPMQERANIRMQNMIAPSTIGTAERFSVSCELVNGSKTYLSSFAPNPIHLSYRWISNDSGNERAIEGERTKIFPPLPAGRSFRYWAEILAPSEPGQYKLRLTLVQEMVCWFDAADLSCFQSLQITVA